jgi:hypothetical protein
MAAGCTNLKQMPSSPVVVQERSLKPITTQAVYALPPAALEVPAIIPSISKVPDKDFVLESTDKDYPVIQYISERFKISPQLATEIVKLATEFSHATFPKRNDILALIAVESSYNVNARSRGCHGLMQVEKASHRKLIKGRNLHNPRVNIEVGSTVLHEIYEILHGNKRGSILSFNAGVGNFLKGRYESAYYTKYKKELKLLSGF